MAMVRVDEAKDPQALLVDSEVQFFRTLGNGQRLRILESLLDGEKSVSQLVAATGIPQSQVSNGLKCLKWCGFVAARPDGRLVHYRLADSRVPALLALARAMVTRHAEELYSCTTLFLEDGALDP